MNKPTDNQIIAEINDNVGETYSEYEAHEMYDTMLDEIYGMVKIAGHEYGTSSTLREIDPIAYRVGFTDWCDNEELDELEYLPAVDKYDDRIEIVYAYRRDIETATEQINHE